MRFTFLLVRYPAWAVQEDRSHSRPFAPRLDEVGRYRVPAKRAASLQTLTRSCNVQTGVRVRSNSVICGGRSVDDLGGG
jgi:hypothetical protein